MSGKNLIPKSHSQLDSQVWLENVKMISTNQIAGFLNFNISKTIESAKETIKPLRSQKQKDIWKWFFACTFISIKVMNWFFKFRWVWSHMPREAQRVF